MAPATRQVTPGQTLRTPVSHTIACLVAQCITQRKVVHSFTANLVATVCYSKKAAAQSGSVGELTRSTDPVDKRHKLFPV